MNDRFKFRAWDKRLKEMIVRECGDAQYNPFGVWSGVRDDDILWMQCTGMKDKNGKLVYEGDIVQADNGYRMVIEWDDDLAGYDYPNLPYKVKGNIHENPSLLDVLKRDSDDS